MRRVFHRAGTERGAPGSERRGSRTSGYDHLLDCRQGIMKGCWSAGELGMGKNARIDCLEKNPIVAKKMPGEWGRTGVSATRSMQVI